MWQQESPSQIPSQWKVRRLKFFERDGICWNYSDYSTLCPHEQEDEDYEDGQHGPFPVVLRARFESELTQMTGG